MFPEVFFLTSDIDISQTNLMDKFCAWLKTHGEEKELIHAFSRRSLVDKFVFNDVSNGHCVGFTMLWALAKYSSIMGLSSHHDASVFNIAWLNAAYASIAKWEPSDHSRETASYFSKITKAISYFQQHYNRGSRAKAFNFELLSSDIRIEFNCEFYFAANFSANELADFLEQYIPYDKLVFFGANRHITGLIRHKYHDNGVIRTTFAYYNSNLRNGESQFTSDQLAECILRSHGLSDNGLFSITIYGNKDCVAEEKKSYPSPTELLGKLSNPLAMCSGRYSDPKVAVKIAILEKRPEMLAALLKSGAEVLSKMDYSGIDFRGMNLCGLEFYGNDVLTNTIFASCREFAKYCNGNAKETLKSLLLNRYICSGSAEARFFQGAWNRKHVGIVKEFIFADKFLDDPNLSLEDAIKKLLNMISASKHPININGELCKILTFALQYNKSTQTLDDLLTAAGYQKAQITSIPSLPLPR